MQKINMGNTERAAEQREKAQLNLLNKHLYLVDGNTRNGQCKSTTRNQVKILYWRSRHIETNSFTHSLYWYLFSKLGNIWVHCCFLQFSTTKGGALTTSAE